MQYFLLEDLRRPGNLGHQGLKSKNFYGPSPSSRPCKAVVQTGGPVTDLLIGRRGEEQGLSGEAVETGTNRTGEEG